MLVALAVDCILHEKFIYDMVLMVLQWLETNESLNMKCKSLLKVNSSNIQNMYRCGLSSVDFDVVVVFTDVKYLISVYLNFWGMNMSQLSQDWLTGNRAVFITRVGDFL